MSLLTSLMKASAQFQQLTGNQARGPEPAPGAPAKSAEPETRRQGNDDTFTISGQPPRQKSAGLAVGEYRQQVGQDLAFVRETLRHKLAEYSLRPTTQLGVARGQGGEVELAGRMPEQQRLQIEKDLNNSKAFRDAFSRLSVNQPTLSFVDNALKLNQAYGARNAVLDTLVSNNAEFNGLPDLAHRYDNIRRAAGGDDPAPARSAGYAFSLNARA